MPMKTPGYLSPYWWTLVKNVYKQPTNLRYAHKQLSYHLLSSIQFPRLTLQFGLRFEFCHKQFHFMRTARINAQDKQFSSQPLARNWKMLRCVFTGFHRKEKGNRWSHFLDTKLRFWITKAISSLDWKRRYTKSNFAPNIRLLQIHSDKTPRSTDRDLKKNKTEVHDKIEKKKHSSKAKLVKTFKMKSTAIFTAPHAYGCP